MKTYIRKSIKGYYIQFNKEIDPQYWADQIGSTYQDFADGKWVLLSDEQAVFHEAHPTATVQQVLDMAIPVYTRTLQEAIQEKLGQIEEYDNSENVNGFNINKDGSVITDWFTPEKRSNYKSSIEAAELLGIDTLTLLVQGHPITLPTQDAKVMLAQIQLYADQCYLVTESHKAAVQNLDAIEAVDSYDYTLGYPEKLNFNLSNTEEV